MMSRDEIIEAKVEEIFISLYVDEMPDDRKRQLREALEEIWDDCVEYSRDLNYRD